jgi:hypothetical protein
MRAFEHDPLAAYQDGWAVDPECEHADAQRVGRRRVGEYWWHCPTCGSVWPATHIWRYCAWCGGQEDGYWATLEITTNGGARSYRVHETCARAISWHGVEHDRDDDRRIVVRLEAA